MEKSRFGIMRGIYELELLCGPVSRGGGRDCRDGEERLNYSSANNILS